MLTRETFFRADEVRRESRRLPAATYNLARILLTRIDSQVLFVPVRSMQFLAVIDAEEFIFIDAAVSRTDVALAWQGFRPWERSGLDEPVGYDAVFYQSEALTVMNRLQGEFQRALRQSADRLRATAGSVVQFPGAH